MHHQVQIRALCTAPPLVLSLNQQWLTWAWGSDTSRHQTELCGAPTPMEYSLLHYAIWTLIMTLKILIRAILMASTCPHHHTHASTVFIPFSRASDPILVSFLRVLDSYQTVTVSLWTTWFWHIQLTRSQTLEVLYLGFIPFFTHALGPWLCLSLSQHSSPAPRILARFYLSFSSSWFGGLFRHLPSVLQNRI